MTALTANAVRFYKTNGDVLEYEMDGAIQHIYDGALVNLNASGYAEPSTDTADNFFVGVAQSDIDQPAVVASGTNKIRVIRKGSNNIFKLDIVTVVDNTSIGSLVYIVDDNTVDLVAGVSNSVEVGIIREVYSANSVGVQI